jgi:hypothetical protein
MIEDKIPATEGGILRQRNKRSIIKWVWHIVRARFTS